MPNMGTWSWLSWLACIIFQIAVACMLYRGNRFPAIRWFLTCKTVISLTLLSILTLLQSNFWYFYVYYFGVMVGSLFCISIISTFVTSFVDSPEMRYSLQVGLRYMGAAYFLGAGLFSFLSPLPFDERTVSFCAGVSRCTSLASLAVFVCVVIVARALRLTWQCEHLGMAVGYALLSLGNLEYDWLFGLLNTQTLSDVRAGFSLAAFLTWIITLRSAVRFPARLCQAPKLI